MVWCGGSIYSSNVIISAAHCFKNKGTNEPFTSFEKFEIVAGELSPIKNANDGQRRKIKDILFHPEHNNTSQENDICLLFMDEDFDFDYKVRKISPDKVWTPADEVDC